MMSKIIKQGEIYVTNFDNGLFIRAAVVMSNNFINKGPLVIMAPCFLTGLSGSLFGFKILADNYEGIERDTFVNVCYSTAVKIENLRGKITSLNETDYKLMIDSWKQVALLEEGTDLSKDKILFYYNQKTNIDDEDRTTECKLVPEDDVSNFIKLKICKYVSSFLNSVGGRILFGIEDNTFIVKGITLTPEEKDKLRSAINNSIRSNIRPSIDPTSIHINFHQVFLEDDNVYPNLFVLEVKVSPPSEIKLYFDKKIAYVRVDGDSPPLEGPEITDWIIRRLKNDN